MVATVNASTSAGVVITPDNSGVLAFQSSSATALTIDASQNVGIGATPNSKLYVRAATNANLRITDASGTLNLSAENDAGSAQVAMKFNGSQMILDATGNLGIGTASPAGKLSVYGTGALLTFQNATTGSTGADGSYIALDGSNLQISNKESADLIFYTADTDRLRIDSAGNFIVGNSSVSSINGGGGGSAFWNSGTNNIRRLQIGSNSTGSSQLTSWNTPNGEVGNITVSGVSTTYNTSSDYRLKENIAPMIGALAKVSQLKPCTFNWKWNGSDSQGFIAHELQAVVPECVTGEKDATHQEEYEVTPAVKNAQGNITTPAVMGTRTVPKYQSVDTSFLVATLTAAIQELKAINDTLTARIVALENR